MRNSGIVATAVFSSLMLVAAPAGAAADYLLKIDGIKGGAATMGQPAEVEVLSYSWGTSNPTSVARPKVQTPPAASPPPAPGKSAGTVADKTVPRGDMDGDGRADVVTAGPAQGAVSELTVRFRESPALPSTGITTVKCVAGQHIGKATLTGRGQRYELQDVIVTSCTQQGAERQMQLKGHVTLIK